MIVSARQGMNGYTGFGIQMGRGRYAGFGDASGWSVSPEDIAKASNVGPPVPVAENADGSIVAQYVDGTQVTIPKVDDGGMGPPAPVKTNADGSTVVQYPDGLQMTIPAGEKAPDRKSKWPMYLAAGGGALALVGLGYALFSKRSKR